MFMYKFPSKLGCGMARSLENSNVDVDVLPKHENINRAYEDVMPSASFVSELGRFRCRGFLLLLVRRRDFDSCY